MAAARRKTEKMRAARQRAFQEPGGLARFLPGHRAVVGKCQAQLVAHAQILHDLRRDLRPFRKIGLDLDAPADGELLVDIGVEIGFENGVIACHRQCLRRF
jgi:hypothetical protein